jgi:hypothetical protein
MLEPRTGGASIGMVFYTDKQLWALNAELAKYFADRALGPEDKDEPPDEGAIE